MLDRQAIAAPGRSAAVRPARQHAIAELRLDKRALQAVVRKKWQARRCRGRPWDHALGGNRLLCSVPNQGDGDVFVRTQHLASALEPAFGLELAVILNSSKEYSLEDL